GALERGPQPGDRVQQRCGARVVVGDVLDREVVRQQRPLHHGRREHGRGEHHEHVPPTGAQQSLVVTGETDRERPDAQHGAAGAEREREDSERSLHVLTLPVSTSGGLYSLPCLMRMRSESNAAPLLQWPSHTTGAPSLNSPGGSPRCTTGIVALPSVTSKR